MEQPAKNYIRWHVWAMIFISVIAIIFLIGWAMLRLNYKMRLMRESFVDFMSIAMRVVLGAAILVLLLVALINYYGREKITHERTGKTDIQDEV